MGCLGDCGEALVDEVHPNVTRIVVGVNAENSQHRLALETQQTLFSWAEFIAKELAKSARRNGKLKPAKLSDHRHPMFQNLNGLSARYP